jgi:hypothetical protein
MTNEWKELVTLEYMITHGYSDDEAKDIKRLKELRKKCYDKIKIPKWEKAFPHSNMKEEEKKSLYERYAEELSSPFLDFDMSPMDIISRGIKSEIENF